MKETLNEINEKQGKHVREINRIFALIDAPLDREIEQTVVVVIDSLRYEDSFQANLSDRYFDRLPLYNHIERSRGSLISGLRQGRGEEEVYRPTAFHFELFAYRTKPRLRLSLLDDGKRTLDRRVAINSYYPESND